MFFKCLNQVFLFAYFLKSNWYIICFSFKNSYCYVSHVGCDHGNILLTFAGLCDTMRVLDILFNSLQVVEYLRLVSVHSVAFPSFFLII